MVTHSESKRSMHPDTSHDELHTAMQAAQQANERLVVAIGRMAQGGVETHQLPTANLLRIVLQRTIEGETLDQDCEKLIAVLSKVIGDQDLNTRPPRKPTDLPEEGYYRFESDFVKVQESQATGKLYAKRWDADAKKWEYTPGLYFKLRGAQEMSAQDAKDFGDLYGQCVFCGLTLTDERSIDAGYGPKCAENRVLPWG